MSTTTTTQILFIDSRVADADVLLAGLDPSIEIVRLNSVESGLQQMANAVQGRNNISSVHVISHGGPGNLLLGAGVVNQSQLVAEQLALSTLQSALSEDADLLLYGCDVAAGAEGQSFINALASATGADVAASTDLTGGGTAQSDWVLESSTGAIETAAIEPAGYQYDLGYWGNVALYGDRWNVTRGSQNTIVFDADGGGKGSKYGVGNNAGAYNVSNLYSSNYDGGAEAIWYTFTGSASAVPGSPWYVSNWDADAGGYTYWGAYANATPSQVTTSITLAQGASQTLFVGNLVSDDYYSAGDIWKYLVGASASGYVSSSSLSIANTSAKYATFYAPNVQSWKGTVYLGSITYSVNDGVNYSVGGSLNPDYYSSYSRYKSATYTTAVYGTYVDDAIVWPSSPTNQTWSNQTRNTLNYGRGAVEPDASDSVTGYHLMNITDVTGGANTNLDTSLPGWITASGANGNTLSVKNLAPEYANKTYQLTVEARSSADVAGTADDNLTKVQKHFTITTGTVEQLNDRPTSPGNTLVVREDRALVLSATDFNFVDLDNTVGGSSASGARFENVRITSVPANGALKLFVTASGPTVVVTISGSAGVKETVTAVFANVTTETVIKLGTTVAKVAAGATATVVAQTVAYELNNDKFSLFTATASSGTVTLTAKTSGDMTNLTSASFKVLDTPGAALANDAVVTAAQLPNLVFIPTADFSGTTSFGYKVNDGYADAQSPSTMNLSVTAVNDLPVFTSDSASPVTVYDKAASGVTIDPVSGALSAADPEGTVIRYGADGGTANYSGSATYTAPTVALVTAGADSVAQITNVTLAASTQATTVLFNKTTVKLGASDAAAAVATKVANAISANSAEEFTATAAGAVVTLTAKVTGERAELSAADFGYQTLSRQGQYGVITVDQVTGKWVYTPTQTAAINQLKVDETATEVFGLTATDAAGQAAGKALTITIDGENSAPYLANALAETTLNSARQYKLPSDAFKDVDGNTLTLSASIGGTPVPATNDSGLSFNAETGTFTAAGSSTTPLTPQTIVVTASDSVNGAAVATDTFVLGNTAPITAKPLPYKIIKTSSEVTTVTFAAKPAGATTITFDGVPINIGSATTADAVATAMAAVTTYPNFTITASGPAITVTAKAAGDSADITASNFVYTVATASSVVSAVVVDPPVNETVRFELSGTGLAVTGVNFNGVSFDPVATTGLDLAHEILNFYTPNVVDRISNYTIKGIWRTGEESAVFVAPIALGQQTPSDVLTFTGTTLPTVAKSVIPAVNETTTFTFVPRAGETSVVFDGSAAIDISTATTGAEIAAKISAALSAGTANYTVSRVGTSDQIKVVAKTFGDKTNLTSSAFSFITTSATTASELTVGSIVPGGAWSYEIPADTFTDANGDPMTVSVFGTYQGVAPTLATAPATPTDSGQDVTVIDFTAAAIPSKIRFEKQIVNISTATAEGTVSALVASINANTASLYTAAVAGTGADAKKLVLTTKALGSAQADPVLADFTTELTTSTELAYDVSLRKISGTGDRAATKLTVVASDGSASVATTFTLETYSTGTPTLPSAVDVDFNGAGSFSYAIPTEAFHLTTAQTFTEFGTWPTWATIVAGKIVANPPASATGTYALEVQGTTGRVIFNVSVSNSNDPLVSSAISSQTIGQGVTTFSLSASGVFTDADPSSSITYQAYADKNRDGDFSDAGEGLVSAGDYWLKFNGTTFTGTPDEALSSVSVKLVATSSDGSTDYTNFQINLPANASGSFEAISIAGGNATAGALTDTNDFTAGNVIYKWQTSTDAGGTWIDVASGGARSVNTSTLSLLPSEVGTQLRVNAYYTDKNGFSETVTSAASALIDHVDVANQTGALSLVGDLKPGYTLFANVTDPNGLATVPTYVWYRSDSDTTFDSVIAGVTGSSYTLTSADSYKYIKVIASYQDKTSGATLTVSAVTNDLATTPATDYVGLDATAPVAVNDVASITENSGVLNATVASGSAAPKTGYLFADDTDANAKTKAGDPISAKRDLFKLADLRTGSIEGDGVQGRKIGTEAAYTFNLKGKYGWLEVTNSGAYSYYLDQNNTTVQGLTSASAALTDVFNYEINDGDTPEFLSDVGTFTLTIAGANDQPTITGGIGRSSNTPAGSATADATAPVLSGSSVNGNKLVLKFNEGLASTDLPAASSFAVSAGGSAVAVSSVAASGSTVVLTLSSVVTNGQVVTVSYNDTTANNDTVALQDNNGNDVATITSASVVNKTPPAGDTAAPSFVSAVLVADQLKLTFSELLNAANLPHEADFTIVVGSTTLTWRDYQVVGVDEDVLTIQLNTAVTLPSTAVTLAYRDWSAGNDVNAIQDLANNDVLTLATTNVVNQTVAVAAETFNASVGEDVASFLNTGGLVFADPESDSVTVKIVANNGARLVAPSTMTSVTVWGSDTSALILTGSASALNAALAGDSVQYITSPNGTLSSNTVTISALDGGGGSLTPVATTTSITIAGKNDSIKLDLDTTNATNGYGYVSLFRPRGEAVKISNANSTISDADGTEITSAVIRIASGAVDNEFGTIFETLSSSLGTTETFTWEGMTVTGNGTTDIRVTGLAIHARYKDLIDSISYINANPNAYGGDRQVSIRLTDKYAVQSEQLESNSALLVLATANTAVQVGQRIFIGARNVEDTAWVYTDTLATVATVVNSTHFIASNNLPLLTPSSAIRFLSTGSVASSVANTSITLGSVNGSVFTGQKIYTTAGAEIGTVSSVTGALVNITSTSGALDAGTTIIFETAATSSVTQTSANRTVSSLGADSKTIVLNTIDLSIEAGQVIYEGEVVRGIVHSVSFSGADSGSTTVTTKLAVSDVIPTDTLVFKTFATNLTPTATTTIRNVWTTEVDLNGVLETGRDYSAVFTEGQTGGTPISASSASLDNQSVYVKTVVIALANATDGTSGGDENLFLNPAYITALLGRGITYALSNNNHTLTLSAINQSAGVTAADMQLALRAVQYENLSQNPSVTPRIVNVTVTDITNTLTNSSLEGVAARTTINITPSNDAPTLAGDFAATALEGGAYTLTTGDLSPSDIDNDYTTLRYEVTSTSSSITVFRDINGDGQVDAGEAIAVRNGSTAGQEFTQAEVIAGNIKVKQNGTDVPIIGLTEAEAENLVNSAVYTNASANPSAGLRQVIFQSSAQMSSLGSAGTTVGQPKIALQTGSKTIDGVTYAVVMSGSDATSVATLTVSKAGTGFTEAEAQAIVASLRYGNTAATPTSGDPTVSLSSVVTLTETTEDSPSITVSTVSSVMASAAEANAFDASDVTAANIAIPTPKNIAKLVFTVTNVAPADAEYLKLLGAQDQVDITGSASDLFTGIDLSTPAAGDSYKTLSFKVTGVSDGVNETITFGSGATSHVVPLVVGSVVKDGVIYAVTAGSSATERLLTVTKPFAAIGLSLRDNGENNVLPVAASINLTITPVNDAPTFSATVAGGTFIEGGTSRALFSSAAVSDGDTSGAEQNITELTLTITGVRDGSAEKLVVGGQTISLTSGAVVGGSLGYAVTVAGSTASVTLTKTDSASAWATLINGMAYQNTSNAPTNGNRVVTLKSLKDSGGTTNSGADTKALNLASTVTVQGIDSAPVVTSSGATVQSGGLLTITSASPVMLTATDADSSSDVLVYTLTSGTSQGTLFLDKNANSDVDEGETLVASAEFTQTDLNNGTLKYFHTGAAGADAFSFRVKDATTTLSPTTFDITVSAAGGVTGSGTSTANSTDGSDTLFKQVAIATNTGESVKTLTFKVAGATDGSAEYLTVNGQDVHLTAGTTTVDGVTYTVVDDGSGNFTVSVTSATGFTATDANAIVNGASYGNDAVPPSSGERAISLATVTTTNGSSTFTTATNIGAVTTIVPTVDVFTAAQADAAIGTLTGGDDIKALTFTVSGVKDGANEVIKINGQEIPLVAGSPVVIDGVTYQVTASSTAGTFIVTMTDAIVPGLTALQAEAIVAGVTLSNSDNTPTDGARSVSLTSYSTGPAAGTSITLSPTTGLASSISSTTAVNGASVEPLSGAVISAPADVDVLTFSVSGVQDGSDEVLVIGGFSVPLVNGASLSNAAGTYAVTVTNGVATVVFTPATALSSTDAQTLVSGVDYLNNASPLTEGDRTVSLVSLSVINSNMSISQSATGSVSVAVVDGVYPAAQPLALSLFDAAKVIAAIPAPTSGNDFKSVSFTLAGIADGAQEVFQINGQDIPLVPGTVTVNGVTYEVALSVSGIYTVTLTDTTLPGFTEEALQAIVSGATLTNTSSTATEGVRTVTLGTVLQGLSTVNTGSTAVTLSGTAPTGSVVAPNTPVNAMAGDVVTVPEGSSVDSLTFTVTGVKDGAAEVLKFGAAPNIISVPLVNGTVTSTVPAGTYAVSVAANGTATVVFTPTVELTQDQANSLIGAATYTNTSNEPTGGVRSLDLTSMDVLTGSTVTPTAITNVGGDIAVQGTTEGAPVFDASDVLPTLAGKTVDSMTFTVAGIKDGANEVLLVNGLTVPLVAGTVTSTSPAGAYVVTVNGGTATVVFTPTTNLTEAQANALLEGVTYDNKSTDVTGGDRVVSLSSLVTTNPDGSANAPIAPTTITGTLPVLVSPPEYVPLFNPTQVNAAIAAPTAGNDYKSISFNLTGIADGASEIFKVNGQNIPLVPGTMTLNGVTYTVTGSGPTYTVTVTDTFLPGFTETDLQTLANGVVLINTDSTPTEGVRGVTIGTLVEASAQVSPVTLGGTAPAAAVVTPNTPVNALAGDTVTVASGSTVDSLTFTVTGVANGASEVLKFGVSPNITSVPLVHGGSITSTTDPLGIYSVSVSSGTATVVFTPTSNLSESATNALIAGATYTNTNTTPTEGVRTLSLTGMAVDNAGTVTQTSVSTVTGQIPVKASTTPLFDSDAVSTAIPALTSGNDFKSVSFNLTGIKDGAAEVFRVNGQDIPLVVGTVTVAGVTYTVTGTGTNFQVTVTDTTQPGFTEAALQTLVGGATLTNTSTSPSSGARGVTLGTVTEVVTSTTSGSLASAVSASVLAPDTPVRAMQGDSVDVDATTSVDSLTFTVTGVKDGAAEVFKFGATTVPLVNGTVSSTTPAGSFLVTVNDAGTARVVFRPDVNLTDAETDTLIGAATYTNTSSTPTGGVRTLDLTSMDIQTTSGGAVTATAVTNVGGVIPVQGVMAGESVFNSAAVVPNLTTGKTVDSLTFGVTGVKDGSNEVLVINGVTVPLVNSSSISDGSGGSYSVVVTNGNAVVVYTPAANLTEAQANALLSGITYENKASNVTDGARGFSVISMDTVDANNVTTTTATPGLDSVVSYGDVTNTAPVVTVNASVTVAENQTVTLASSHLAVTDAQQNNLDLVFTVTDAVDRGQLFRDLNGNGLINSGEALAVGGTFTQAELIGGRIKYRHDGSETRSDTFKFTASDGIDTTAAQPFVISVTSVNDMPAGRPSIDGVIAQHAVLTASLTSMTDGDGLPASIQYTWKADGQTVGANAATYTLTAAEIDKKITLSVAYTDLAGFSHTVTSLATAPVVNVNDAPTLSASTLTVFEGGTITLNTSQIVAADQDGLTLDHQFKLITAPTKGQIYLDVNGNGLLDSGSESALAANGTFTQDDLFNGRVRYQHLGSEDGDSFGLQAIDGGGLPSATAAFTVTRTAVNDAPTFQNLGGDVIAVPTVSVAVLLDSVASGDLAAVVSDVDSNDLNGGQLRVAVNFNRNPAKDSLAIKQVGTGNGQISTADAFVKFGATTIGTFAGGSGANDLLVTFNALATKEAIAALVSAITFKNDESIPAESVRTVAFTLTDGDGGTSDVARVTVNLEANGAPTFLNASTSMAVYENSTQVGVFAATDPLRLVTTYSISSRTDSSNVDRAKFSINAATGVLTFVSAPDFETPVDAGNDNHYNLVVRATNANGYSELPVEVAIIDQVTGAGEVGIDRTPPAYVMGTLSGNTLVLYFSEATSLNAVNKPDRSAFTVTAGNTAVAIAALAVNATAKTVTLTLETALSSSTGLSVAYADPTAGNDTAALQDIAGNDAASFTVSNIVLMTGGGGAGSATGVTAAIENQVTSLASGNAVTGDGNGDGIADANQSAVASVPMMITSMPVSAPNNSAMTYITLVAASISGKVGASELTQITEITQRDMPTNVPTSVVMPMGLIDFTATVAVAGGTNTFSLYVDSTLSFNGYWKQDSKGFWTNLASAAYGGSITEEGGKLRIDFTIKDGGEFDEDGLANGVIVDPGAIGTLPLSIVGMHAVRPEGEGWF